MIRRLKYKCKIKCPHKGQFFPILGRVMNYKPGQEIFAIFVPLSRFNFTSLPCEHSRKQGNNLQCEGYPLLAIIETSVQIDVSPPLNSGQNFRSLTMVTRSNR